MLNAYPNGVPPAPQQLSFDLAQAAFERAKMSLYQYIKISKPLNDESIFALFKTYNADPANGLSNVVLQASAYAAMQAGVLTTTRVSQPSSLADLMTALAFTAYKSNTLMQGSRYMINIVESLNMENTEQHPFFHSKALTGSTIAAILPAMKALETTANFIIGQLEPQLTYQVYRLY
jgi:hypothetical protein